MKPVCAAGGRGRQQGGQSVDGKHPDGGGAVEFEISAAESLKGSKDDFQKPAEKSAVNIIVNEFLHVLPCSFFHDMILGFPVQAYLYTTVAEKAEKERRHEL